MASRPSQVHPEQSQTFPLSGNSAVGLASLPAASPATFPDLSGFTPRVAEATQTVVRPATQVSRLYRPELDAIRFFLFIGVLFNHSVHMHMEAKQAWVHNPILFKVVPFLHDTSCFCLSFFFFLSSYLITSLLGIEKQRTGTVDLKRFFLRRMLRLYPLYIGYIALVCVLYPFVSSGYRGTVGSTIALLTFSGNWYRILVAPLSGLVFHLWSVSMEEQFYLVFPFMHKRFSPRTIVRMCLAIAAVALATTYYLAVKNTDQQNIWENSFVESIFFVSGILFALKQPLKERIKSGKMALLGIGIGLFLWMAPQVSGVIRQPSHQHPLLLTVTYLLGDLGCAFILWGTLRMPESWVLRPLVYLGRITYSLYILHALVLYLFITYGSRFVHTSGMSFVLELFICIGVGALSYHFYEKPFLRLKHRFEVVHSRTL